MRVAACDPGVTLCSTAVLLSEPGDIPLVAAEEKGLVRFLKPELLSFDELVELEKNDAPAAPLAAKLERLLTTPIINEAVTSSGYSL